MEFFEKLPPNCPPPTASDKGHSEAWRLVVGEIVKSDDFMSYAAQGKPVPAGVSDCRWASCSLFKTKTQVSGLTKLPKFKGKNCLAACLEIPESVGMSLEKENGHIDFWGFKNFEPLKLLKNVEEFDA